MKQIIHLENLSQVHKGLGVEEPKHPLISVVDASKINVTKEAEGQRFTGNFYMIMMKDADCGLHYGRNYYDFDEGMLSFFAPNQVLGGGESHPTATGWMLFFHPDLIRHSNLGQHIHEYSFFSYDVYEALHLSKKEEDILNDIVAKIEYECDQNLDGHSQTLLVNSLEMLLNYSKRFYERQFHTRVNENKDVVSKVEHLLLDYYKSEMQLELGTPSVNYLADQINLSANYLSDLLKQETGRNAMQHINYFIVERAKTKLLNSEMNVNELAYDLGFNYPHYFGRMFKKSTGLTPQQFRKEAF